MDTSDIGKAVRILRARTALSLQAFATKFDISIASAVRYEQGTRRPSDDLLGRFAKLSEQIAREAKPSDPEITTAASVFRAAIADDDTRREAHQHITSAMQGVSKLRDLANAALESAPESNSRAQKAMAIDRAWRKAMHGLSGAVLALYPFSEVEQSVPEQEEARAS